MQTFDPEVQRILKETVSSALNKDGETIPVEHIRTTARAGMSLTVPLNEMIFEAAKGLVLFQRISFRKALAISFRAYGYALRSMSTGYLAAAEEIEKLPDPKDAA